MTSEEIKEHTSMRDVLAMYGIKTNRSGMCSCPWHKDRKPSMKVFKDGYNCFSCGRNGDIFKFIQEVENCSFKQAFVQLGGTYEKQSDVQHTLIRRKFLNSKKKKEHESLTEEQLKWEVISAMESLEYIADYASPLSEIWCWANNQLTFIHYIWEEKYIQGNEVNEIDVYRVCRKIRQRIHSG